MRNQTIVSQCSAAPSTFLSSDDKLYIMTEQMRTWRTNDVPGTDLILDDKASTVSSTEELLRRAADTGAPVLLRGIEDDPINVITVFIRVLTGAPACAVFSDDGMTTTHRLAKIMVCVPPVAALDFPAGDFAVHREQNHVRVEPRAESRRAERARVGDGRSVAMHSFFV